ncbi:unnamed protein product [Ectocarpus sp. 6 AP-2014]
MVMVSAAIRPLGLVVLAALAVSTAAQSGSNCEVSDLDEYEFMHSPTHGFIIYWTHDTDTVSFMVEAESEQWTAVGFSPDGDMVGSDAVIYRPEDEEVSEQFLDAQKADDPPTLWRGGSPKAAGTKVSGDFRRTCVC